MRLWLPALLLFAGAGLVTAGPNVDRVELTACPVTLHLAPGASAIVRGEALAPRAGVTLAPVATLRAASGEDGARSLGLVGGWKVQPSRGSIASGPDQHVPLTWRIIAPKDVDVAASRVEVALGLANASPEAAPVRILALLSAEPAASVSCARANYQLASAQVAVGETRLAPWGLAATLGASGLLALSAARARRGGAAWWGLGPLLPLFTRLRSSRLLDHATRERIHATVVERPGITFAQLRDELELSTGVVDHHTRALVKGGLLSAHKEGRHRAYYALGVDASRGEPRLGETAGRVLALVDARGDVTYAEIMRELSLSKPAVSHHVHALSARGLVELVRLDDGRWVVRRAPRGVRTNS